MAKGVQLLAYADRFGGDIRGMHDLLRLRFAGCFSGVHLLPFYFPIDGADAGFDPVDHRTVDRRLGDWSDVRDLAGSLDVTADLIVNHISADSAEFEDYRARGSDSPHASLFLTQERVFPQGFTSEDRHAIYRPRPTDPFLPCILGSGEEVQLWTTFTEKQIDIDVTAPAARAYLQSVLRSLAEGDVRTVRLDAIGYAVKKAGSSCYMLPETFEFMGSVAQWVRQHGMTSLAELHAHYTHQLTAAHHVDYVYDFALPPLLLHTLGEGNSRALKHWFSICPHNAITVLDTHDGIGVMDIGADPLDRAREGLIPPQAIDDLVERIHLNSGGVSKRASRQDVGNLDLYQVNCTYYDALGRNDTDYLLARAIQFFAPGIPQVYYVGLLAGENDVERLKATAQGREVNRSFFSDREIDEHLRKPVVQSLLSLIRFRNSSRAFDGEFAVVDSADSQLILRRWHGATSAELHVDLASREFELHYQADGEARCFRRFEELPLP